MSDNPFLLPPGGAKPAPPPAVRDAAPATRPEHYIAVPASVESATHRVARAEPPTDPPAEPPTDEVADPPTEPPADEVAEETRVAPTAPPATRVWLLELPDGTRLPLTGPLLLGRDPAAITDRPEAERLALSDPGKTVSKTHALLEPSSEGVRVRELHSTNGVAVDAPDGRRVAPAGGELVAPAGATILLRVIPHRGRPGLSGAGATLERMLLERDLLLRRRDEA